METGARKVACDVTRFAIEQAAQAKGFDFDPSKHGESELTQDVEDEEEYNCFRGRFTVLSRPSGYRAMRDTAVQNKTVYGLTPVLNEKQKWKRLPSPTCRPV